MNLNKLMLATVIALSTASVAQAATNQGSGKVTFFGEIIDAPCSLSPDSVDQEVNMGQVSNRLLANQGKTASQPFEIKLIDCDNTTKKTVKVAFTGQKDANNASLLGLSGTASGAGIQIVDGSGQNVSLDGVESNALTLLNGAAENTLRYSAYLQGSKTGTTVVPGDFTAVANFTLAYQ